jgi:hypothetical protein
MEGQGGEIKKKKLLLVILDGTMSSTPVLQAHQKTDGKIETFLSFFDGRKSGLFCCSCKRGFTTVG